MANGDMQAHRVLVTAVGGNVGQGVIKSLRSGARSYHITGIDMEPLSAWFSMCDSYYTVPRTGSAEFSAALGEILEKEKIEAVYVCSPTELDYFSRNKERLESGHDLCVMVNPERVIDIGTDKLKTAMFLRGNGFPYPATASAGDQAGVKKLADEKGFPLIVKPRAGYTAKNVFLVNSLREIEALTVIDNDLVAQEYLPDENSEHTSGVVCGRDGKARAVITLRRHLVQGTTYRTELAANAEVDGMIARMAEALGVVGACNFQFRLVNGTCVVFEINPRFSGTSGIRYLYGLNEPEMAFELLRLGIERPAPELKDAVVMRYWNEIHVPGATFDTLKSGLARHDGTQKVFDQGKRA